VLIVSCLETRRACLKFCVTLSKCRAIAINAELNLSGLLYKASSHLRLNLYKLIGLCSLCNRDNNSGLCIIDRIVRVLFLCVQIIGHLIEEVKYRCGKLKAWYTLLCGNLDFKLGKRTMNQTLMSNFISWELQTLKVITVKVFLSWRALEETSQLFAFISLLSVSATFSRAKEPVWILKGVKFAYKVLIALLSGDILDFSQKCIWIAKLPIV